ncbi:MAG: cell division protein FtsB [Burkholderiaceae bacterium]
MRVLPTVLAALVIAIQYPLWLGKGGWVRVWELDRQLERQQQDNASQDLRNTALESEVADLRRGLVAIEERARYELGMVRPDELYVQINPSGDANVSPSRRDASGSPEASRYDIRTADASGYTRPESLWRRHGAGRREP